MFSHFSYAAYPLGLSLFFLISKNSPSEPHFSGVLTGLLFIITWNPPGRCSPFQKNLLFFSAQIMLAGKGINAVPGDDGVFFSARFPIPHRAIHPSAYAHQHMEENLSRSLVLGFIEDDQAFLPDKICTPISIGLLIIVFHR